jgi:stress response protein YsnF
MSGGSPPIHGVLGDLEDTGGGARVLPLHKEEVAVSKRVRKTLIRATRTTSTRDTVVEEELHHDQVVVERVAIGRVVDALCRRFDRRVT